LKEHFIFKDEQRAVIDCIAGIMDTVEVGRPVSVDMKVVVEPAADFVTLDVYKQRHTLSTIFYNHLFHLSPIS